MHWASLVQAPQVSAARCRRADRSGSPTTDRGSRPTCSRRRRRPWSRRRCVGLAGRVAPAGRCRCGSACRRADRRWCSRSRCGTCRRCRRCRRRGAAARRRSRQAAVARAGAAGVGGAVADLAAAAVGGRDGRSPRRRRRRRRGGSCRSRRRTRCRSRRRRRCGCWCRRVRRSDSRARSGTGPTTQVPPMQRCSGAVARDAAGSVGAGAHMYVAGVADLTGRAVGRGAAVARDAAAVHAQCWPAP